MKRNRGLRFVPPIVLLVLLCWLMVGCVYVPWFEQKRFTSETDFRPLIGPADSNVPLRLRHATRAQVIAALGSPMLTSGDGRAIGYRLDTITGYWIYPLCFTAVMGSSHVYLVKLQFDADDRLVRYDMADDWKVDNFFGVGIPDRAATHAEDRLNESEPRIYQLGWWQEPRSFPILPVTRPAGTRDATSGGR